MPINHSGWLSVTVQCPVTHKPQKVLLFVHEQDGKPVVLLSNGCDFASGNDLCSKCAAEEKLKLQDDLSKSGRNPFEPDVFYP